MKVFIVVDREVFVTIQWILACNVIRSWTRFGHVVLELEILTLFPYSYKGTALTIGSFFNDSLAPCFYNCFLYLKTWGEHIGLVIITTKMAFLPELRQNLNILVPIFDIDIHLNFIHNQNLDFICHGLNLVQSHSALWENKNILNW